MKLAWNPRIALAGGLLIVILANAWMLLDVAWRRSGEPESVITLGAREIRLDPDWNRDEGVTGDEFSLRWQPALDAGELLDPSFGANGLIDLDAARLRALGYALEPGRQGRALRERLVHLGSREVLAALEQDGPARRALLARAREALEAARATHAARGTPDEKTLQRLESQLEQLETKGPRLCLIDLGLDRQALRARHPDRARVAIVRARLQPFVVREASAERLRAWVRLLPPAILVPAEFNALLEQPARHDLAIDAAVDAAVVVDLAFDRALTPWVRGVRALAAPGS